MLTYLTAGESHGSQLTAIINGLPAGLIINPDKINHQLARRQHGYGRGGRMKIETDRVQIVSGVRHGYTLGGPVTLIIINKDWENWREIMDPVNPMDPQIPNNDDRAKPKTTPRPGHADLSGGIKWDHRDLRNVLERASARETTARVALGAVTRQLLESFDIDVFSHVVQIGKVKLNREQLPKDLRTLQPQFEKSEVRCADSATEKQMIEAIKTAMRNKDTLGGVAELVISGLPVGLGGCAQWFDRLDARLAGALMSIQSVKGVEIGLGFTSAGMNGSEVHDQIYYDPDGDPKKKKYYRNTNTAGGFEGGMTNGEDVIVRVASKPISTLNQPLDTVNIDTKEAAKALVERTDSCVVPAMGIVCEAIGCLVMAEAFLNKFGSDNFRETQRNYQNWLYDPY